MSKDEIITSLLATLEQIIDARDYHSEYGEYPPGLLLPDQCFDDWAADVACGGINKIRALT